jgi:hypothetical protein
MKANDEQIEKMAREYADKDLLTRVGLYDYSLRVIQDKCNELTEALKQGGER